jgi:hypothetical protein
MIDRSRKGKIRTIQIELRSPRRCQLGLLNYQGSGKIPEAHLIVLNLFKGLDFDPRH